MHNVCVCVHVLTNAEVIVLRYYSATVFDDKFKGYKTHKLLINIAVYLAHSFVEWSVVDLFKHTQCFAMVSHNLNVRIPFKIPCFVTLVTINSFNH